MSATTVSLEMRKCGSEWAACRLSRSVHRLFLSNFWGLAILKKLNIETHSQLSVADRFNSVLPHGIFIFVYPLICSLLAI